MPSRFIVEKSVKDRVQRVLQGTHAIVGRIVDGAYYPEGGTTDEALQVH